jgi:ATP-binding cassette subfamily B protein
LRRIEELLCIRGVVVDGPGAPLPDGALAVEFRAVSFAYGAAEPVLHDISFQLASGEVLGLLGRTGSGKSTIARLVTRLYDPTGGAVLLGGVDLRAARVADVRARVGLVTQDIQLFHARVRDNLTFFDRDVPDERILAALGDLGLWEWYRRLPDGLDTKLASGGGGLSAGEAQLMAFTRVFLRAPQLVILDEASSRLDPATERLVDRAVERLLAGRTGIIIAHRLSSVEKADRILVLDDGRIAEEGPRALLAADPTTRFSRLLQSGLREERPA